MTRRCFGNEQVYVDRDGTIRACCIANVDWIRPGEQAFDTLFATKRTSNREIARGDTTRCASGCGAHYEFRGAFDDSPRKVVVYTNTLCPMRCGYCSQALPDGRSEKLLVEQPGNDIRNLRAIIEQILRAPGAEVLREIELSGGDSAFHPEFPRFWTCWPSSASRRSTCRAASSRSTLCQRSVSDWRPVT